ncbi:hypothetical protein AB836_00795 [Rickettsiales bacterium (ex Bugula neritina AB1)]|nr:hypothetical protein AB836_00795 [Rickettsiales bacterium (ex Bugula neritina AB1)]
MYKRKNKPFIILGIETSCDDTCIGILSIDKNKKKILANLKENQNTLHEKYGGIVPEIASRSHLQNIDIIFEEALKTSNISSNDIDLIGVTKEPGLIGSLLVGINFAKGLSIALNKPLIYVNHIEAHILSSFIENVPIVLPSYCLLLSGGHTSLIHYNNLNDYKILESTCDDAAGELFDKVGREMGLPFPAGKHIEKIAKKNKKALPINTPRILSFSGLKTHFIGMVKKKHYNLEDIAHNLQQSIVSLLQKTLKKHCKYNYPIILGGGVTSNKYIRKELKKYWKNILFPLLEMSTDNGIMIAYVSYCYYINKII